MWKGEQGRGGGVGVRVRGGDKWGGGGVGLGVGGGSREGWWVGSGVVGGCDVGISGWGVAGGGRGGGWWGEKFCHVLSIDHFVTF